MCLSSFPPCVLRKGSWLFSLCLSSRKWSGLDGRAQCLDTAVAEPGLGPEPIVLYLATTGGYFCYCCLILSDIVSVPQQRKVCVCINMSVCSCLLTSPYLWCIAAQRRREKGNGSRPPLSTEIVCQLRSHCDEDCFLHGHRRCSEANRVYRERWCAGG